MNIVKTDSKEADYETECDTVDSTGSTDFDTSEEVTSSKDEKVLKLRVEKKVFYLSEQNFRGEC